MRWCLQLFAEILQILYFVIIDRLSNISGGGAENSGGEVTGGAHSASEQVQQRSGGTVGAKLGERVRSLRKL
jgi:hypothetical protein